MQRRTPCPRRPRLAAGLAGAIALAGAVVLGLASCNSRRTSAPPAETKTAAGPSAKAPPAVDPSARLPSLTAEPLAPAARAFLEAASAAAQPPAEKWLNEALTAGETSSLGPASLTPVEAPMPVTVKRAITALQTWAASGEAMSVSEQNEALSLAMTASRLGLALAAALERSDDPTVAALLRLGQALRAPSNTAIAIVIGAKLTDRLGAVLLFSRGQPVTEPFRTFALTEKDALAFGRSSVAHSLKLARMLSRDELKRELSASAGAPPAGSAGTPPASAPLPADPPVAEGGGEEPGLDASSTAAQVLAYRKQHNLPTAGTWIEDELSHYQSFWDETERLAAAATTAPALATLLEQRQAAALAHPTSMLVRLVGEILFSARVPTLVTELHTMARAYGERLAAPAR